MNYSTQPYRHTSRRAISPQDTQRSFIQKRGPMLLGVGAALAGMALFVQYRTKQVEQENPPAGKFVEVDGIRVHYVERGQGQPVVLLHGNGMYTQELESSGLVDLAAEKYRVIALDRPGYGYSDRPRDTNWDPVEQAQFLYRVLQQIGVEQPVVVGHSWGTLVAVALGLEHPEYVRSLVLLSGYYYPTPRVDVPLLSAPAIPVVGDLMRYTISPLLGRMLWPAFIRKLFTPAKTSETFKDGYPVWMSLRPSQLRATTEEIALMIPSAAKLSTRYRELTMPVKIMAGTSDLHVLPELHSQRLHEEVPGSELILVSEVGHMIQHTVPHQVLFVIDRAANAAPVAALVQQSPAIDAAVH